MSQELLYTSAPRGLKPGSRGFCTVLSTQGMPAPLASALEGLSGYRPVFPHGEQHADLNPVVYSHLKLQATGRTSSVLSRIADFGLDYSQRPNKLAHHVVLEKSELPPGGPAQLLAARGFMRATWEGEPKVVALKPVRSEPPAPAAVCEAWQAATGDAGWAGVVAESFLRDPERLVILLFEPGQEILPLFAEAISLLPTSRRWDVTFSTYFTGLAPGATCAWRAMIHDSKEARESLRFVNALRLDLTTGRLGRAEGGPLVEAARTGVRPPEPVSRPVPPPLRPAATEEEPESYVVDLVPDDQDEVEQEPRPIHFATAPPAPPLRIQTPPPQPPASLSEDPTPLEHAAPPVPLRRTGRKLADVIDEESNRLRYRWRFVTALLLLIIATGAAVWFIQRQNATKHETGQPMVSAAAVPQQAVGSLTQPKVHGLGKSKVTSTSPVSTVSVPAASSTPMSGKGNSAKIPAAEPASASAKPVTQPAPPTDPPTPSVASTIVELRVIPSEKGKVAIHSFQWANERTVPTYEAIHEFLLNINQHSTSLFKFRFGGIPPMMTVLTPSWLRWKAGVPQKKTTDQAIFAITLDNVPTATPHASFTFVGNDRSLRYDLKRTGSAEANFLTWCAIDLFESERPDGSKRRIIFYNPNAIPEDKLHLSKKQQSIEWDTPLKWNDARLPALHVDDLSFELGGEIVSCHSSQLECRVEYRHELTDVTDKIKQDVGIVFDRVPAVILRIAPAEDLKFTLSIAGIYGDSDLFASADKQLNDEKGRVKAQDYGSLNPKVGEFLDKLLDEERGAQAVLDVESAVKTPIADLEAKIIKAKDNQSERTKLQEEINRLKQLCPAMKSLFLRYEKLAQAKRDFNNIRITSARISYELFELSSVERSKPSKAYVIDFGKPAMAEIKLPEGTNP